MNIKQWFLEDGTMTLQVRNDAILNSESSTTIYGQIIYL